MPRMDDAQFKLIEDLLENEPYSQDKVAQVGAAAFPLFAEAARARTAEARLLEVIKKNGSPLKISSDGTFFGCCGTDASAPHAKSCWVARALALPAVPKDAWLISEDSES